MTKQAAVIHYKAALVIFSKWLADGLISKDEYALIDEIVAIKYGLSPCSIFREIRLQCQKNRAIMA